MSRKLIFCVILTFAMLFTGTMMAAAQGPQDVYVDPNRTPAGNEDGTKENPYNTVKEGEAYAQSWPNGGNLYVKNADGSWGSSRFVPGVDSGAFGSPFPEATLMALLALLAIVIAIIGWWFLQRARHLSASANKKPASRF